MSPLIKGIVIAVIHVCLVVSLGAKFLYDRSTLPHVWIKTVPYDPNLPIRGRYVSLRIVVVPHGIKESNEKKGWQPAQSVILRVEKDRLLAQGKRDINSYRPSGLHARYITVGEEKIAVLDEPVAFFIPEHMPDPSRRPPGEQLWVEVTIPKKGIPRPIRLGTRKDDGPIIPLTVK